MWRRLLKRAGLGDGASLHFHALRHFAASVMIQQGIPLPDVARLLGHESFDLTLEVHAHPTREMSYHSPAFNRIAEILDRERIARPRKPRKYRG